MSDYPKHCRTVDDVCAYIKEIFGHECIRVERFKVEVVTPKGGTMKLTWDREDVGQKPRTNIRAGVDDDTLDEAFDATVGKRLRKALKP